MASIQNKRATTIAHQYYELDKAYKSSESKVGTNLAKTIKQAQDFYNGNQFPTINTDNSIRVSVNICYFASVIKASKLCGTPIYITFTADDNRTDCTKLREFDEYNTSKLGQKSFNYQSALNGFVNGTEITYIRWDADDTTYQGIYKGGLKYEHIDPLKFAVANNRLSPRDLQNQKWVMFWDYMDLKSIEDLIEGESKKEIEEKKRSILREIYSDEEIRYEEVYHKVVKVYTRFFRIDGEVHFECSTETVDLFTAPKPLNRRLNTAKIKKIIDEYQKNIDKLEPDREIIKDYDIDPEDIVMQQYKSVKLNAEEYKNIKEKFSLYPFVAFVPINVNNAFWGRSDLKGLIPIQKALNYMITMTLKCAENNAYNKILVKEDALSGQVITNEPGQVIVDHSQFSNQWGIKMLETPPVPNSLLDFSDRLFAIARVVYGFNDVMDGSVTNKDMSGYMLQQMIKQSNTSIEQQQQIFWEYQEDLASIRLMFYKHYVDKAKYTSERDYKDFTENENARKLLAQAMENGYAPKTMPNATAEDFNTPTHRVKVEEISGDELYGVNFDISIDAMQGLEDSKLVEQQMWDNLFLNGGIQNIPPQWLKAYFESSPNVSPRTKIAIQGVIEEEEKSRIAQLENQLQEVVMKTQQIINYAQQLENTIGYQGNYLKNLTSEFTSKIETQNSIITGLTKDLQQYREPKEEGEVKSNNSRGVGGGVISSQA